MYTYLNKNKILKRTAQHHSVLCRAVPTLPRGFFIQPSHSQPALPRPQPLLCSIPTSLGGFSTPESKKSGYEDVGIQSGVPCCSLSVGHLCEAFRGERRLLNSHQRDKLLLPSLLRLHSSSPEDSDPSERARDHHSVTCGNASVPVSGVSVRCEEEATP